MGWTPQVYKPVVLRGLLEAPPYVLPHSVLQEQANDCLLVRLMTQSSMQFPGALNGEYERTMLRHPWSIDDHYWLKPDE